MSRPDQAKVATDGGAGLGQNPFGALAGLANLPAGPGVSAGVKQGFTAVETEKNRGRVDVLRTTAGRGGKTVTVAKNFTGIGLPEKEALCKKMRGAAGCGGTVKDGVIEIQGDQREILMRVLREAGFRPVQAGG
ncbi:MAG: translation initiation factor [Verrucomicrobia bacterium]|nr:translation initiation factor [Verrucomicrobiota bacterium]